MIVSMSLFIVSYLLIKLHKLFYCLMVVTYLNFKCTTYIHMYTHTIPCASDVLVPQNHFSLVLVPQNHFSLVLVLVLNFEIILVSISSSTSSSQQFQLVLVLVSLRNNTFSQYQFQYLHLAILLVSISSSIFTQPYFQLVLVLVFYLYFQLVLVNQLLAIAIVKQGKLLQTRL